MKMYLCFVRNNSFLAWIIDTFDTSHLSDQSSTVYPNYIHLEMLFLHNKYGKLILK
jgi:hypothetical protein